MLRKILFIFLLLFFLVTSHHAVQYSLYLNGGYNQFLDNFSSDFSGSIGWQAVAPDGVAFDLSVSYLAALGEEDVPNLTRTSLKAGLGYYFFPESWFSSYLFGFVSVNFLSDSFVSPGLGYGCKAGFRFANSDYSSWFVEVEPHYIYDGELGLDIFPIGVNLGFLMYLDKPAIPRSFQSRFSRQSQRSLYRR